MFKKERFVAKRFEFTPPRARNSLNDRPPKYLLISQYLENYEDEHFLYVCMELCEGGDLHEKLVERGKPFG